MNTKQIGLLIATAALGGGLTYGLLQDSEPKIPVYEYQVIPKAYVASNGKLVRLVGENPEHALKAVVTSEIGRAALLPTSASPSSDALCNVLFIAKEHPIKGENGAVKPDLPALEPFWKLTMVPKPLGDTEDKKKVWWGILQGYGCAAVGELGNDYLGSSMEQLRALPIGIQKKFLRTMTKKYDAGPPPEPVAVGEDTADPDAEVYFPHEIFGREDLNFEKEQQGKVKKNWKEPEDGFDELPEED